MRDARAPLRDPSADGGRSLSTVLALAALVLNVFSGQWSVMGIPLPLDRIVLFCAVLCLAVTSPVRRDPLDSARLGGPSTGLRVAYTVLAASVALTAASAFFSGSLGTKDGFFALLDRVTMPALLFVLAPRLFPTEGARRALVLTFTLLGVYLGLTSVFEILGPSALVFPRYIMDPTVGILFGRARGPFVEASANGMALLYCGAAAAAGYWVLQRRWRALCLLALVLCLTGALLTYTRSVWLGAVAGLVVYSVAHPRVRRSSPWILGSTAAAFTTAIFTVPALQSAVLDRVGNVRSIDDRTTTNAAALRAFDEHPLTGVGWNHFLSVVDEFVRQQDLVPLTNVAIEPHNVLLSRAAEMGIPGALAWLLTVVVVFAPVLRRPLSTVPSRRAGASRATLPQLRYALIAVLPGYFAVAMLTPFATAFSNAVPFVLAGLLQAQRSAALAERTRQEQPGTQPHDARLVVDLRGEPVRP